MSRLPPGNIMPESGIWFNESSEISSIGTKDYGVSIVTPAFVRDAIAVATGQAAFKRIENGMLYQQDLYLVVNDPHPDFSSLDFHYLPHGGTDHGLWMRSGELCLRGWAADITGAGTPVEVQVFVDEHLQERCIPSVHRPDLSKYFKDERFSLAGWECCCQLADRDPSQMVVVKVVSANGADSLLHVGAIHSLLPLGRVDFCVWTRPDELYLKGWTVDILESGEPLEVQVFVNDRLRQKCLTSMYRPDLREHFGDDRFLYAGWASFCHLPDNDREEQILIKSISPDGTEHTLYEGTIASLLPLTAFDTIAMPSELEEYRLQLKGELDRRLEYIRHLEGEVARKDAALAEIDARLRRWPWQRR